ncbi:toxin [Neobacillus rhizosphaerae]|uniref:anthrax toxin lethal factor-related metalloendopeptidase n=1 Tax=Neobacillus rhizosphaerae TaxID=2880965 RepID=UPI003D26CC01
MRKWIVFFIIAGLFLSIITTSQASFDGISLKEYPENSILYQSLKDKPSLSLLKQIIILPNQIFDQTEAAAIITRIDALPSSLLEKTKKQGISVKLFTGKLTDNVTARHLKGQVPRGYNPAITWDEVPGIGGSKVVLVKIGFSEKGKGHGSVNLELHELAHSIDRYVFSEISQSYEFSQIWMDEHESLFPNNSYFFYQEEYFAETFAMYYLNSTTKKLLQTKAPKTYQFISHLH